MKLNQKYGLINYLRMLRIGGGILFLGLSILAFYGFFAEIMQLQFAPALLKAVSVGSILAIVVVLLVVVISWLIGRFYCSIMCPFGVLQDFIAWIVRPKGRCRASLRKWRYLVSGICFGLVFCGIANGLFWLDPYSNFGRICTLSSVLGIITLCVIIVLNIWMPRFFCWSICPVGTILGLLAAKGKFQLKISEKCVHCGNCLSKCPVGCIDVKSGLIDNERCVRCLNCMIVCPLKGIELSKDFSPVNLSRRDFLTNGAYLFGGAIGAISLFKICGNKIVDLTDRKQFLPPGAVDISRFATKCTGCQLCVAACPSRIIVPSTGGCKTVRLDLKSNSCKFDCNRCMEVCPTGAIIPLSLAKKQHMKIAEANFNPSYCMVFQEGESCGRCANACPTKAIRLRKSGAPYPVNVERCIGCGNCYKVCIAHPQKAITIKSIEKQSLIKE